jgi:hypothetical protein
MPSKSRSQQRLFGAVHRCQKTGKCSSPKIKKIADSISKKDAKDFAKTKHKGLPKKVKNKKGKFTEWLDKKEFSEGCDIKNYMFFSNLKVIKDKIEHLLSLDPYLIDAMLEDGHDWAREHLATSKDDVEEVYNWITSNL